jgi:hypothetical protein
MAWLEVRIDSKGNTSVVKHKGEKPANFPNLSDMHKKSHKAHVLPRGGGEPYIETRGVRPSEFPHTRRPEGLEIPYGHGRSARPLSRNSNTTIPISIHPDDSISSRGRDDYERPPTPRGYGRDGARARRGYNEPASRPVSRDSINSSPWGGNTDVVFPSRAPSRHKTTVSTTDFVHGTGPVPHHSPSRHAESVTRGRDPRPLSRASAPDYDNSPVAGHRDSCRVVHVVDERGRSGYDAPPTPRAPYHVVEHRPGTHAAAPMHHSPTVRILEGRDASSRTGRARSPQQQPSEADELYDRYMRRSHAPSQRSKSEYSQQ